MIFTEVLDVQPDSDSDEGSDDGNKIEVAYIGSNDLSKKILRVTADSGKVYGINISHTEKALKDGVVLVHPSGMKLKLRTIAEKIIVITPSSIDAMGVIAHLLGNSHKPIDVLNGQIVLQHDPVVEDILKRGGIDYSVEQAALKKALRHVNLASR